MTGMQLTAVKRRFQSYLSGFVALDDPLRRMLELKAEHSRRVAEEARALSSALSWPQPKQHAAEALGFLHDVGRFPQLAEHGTFSDADSFDHGKRGAAVVRQGNWLADLSDAESKVVLIGIRHHNARTIPADIPAGSLPLLRLVRDADKLDIFRVILASVERDGFRDLPSMLPHVTLDREPTPEVIAEVESRRSAALGRIKTLGDLLLLQTSWVYDVNYRATFRCIQSRDILSRILAHLDGNPDIHAIVEEARCHMWRRLETRV